MLGSVCSVGRLLETLSSPFALGPACARTLSKKNKPFAQNPFRKGRKKECFLTHFIKLP